LKTLKIKEGNFVRTTSNRAWTWEELNGQDAVAQRIKHRLKLWQGEWFLDRSQGIDWIGVFEKPFSLRKMKSEIYRAVEKDEQVDRIENLDVIPDYIDRSLVIKISIKILAGSETIQISEELRD
jgi:hypothetical protein